MPIEAIATLRERSQLTLPERLVAALDVKPGDDVVLRYDEAAPATVEMTILPRSYKGVAGDLYGKTSDERAHFIAEERANWDSENDPGRAPDGTPYLSFEQSRRVYRQTDVTRERYDTEPKLRWPKCETCGRSIANMREHRRKHEKHVLTDQGISTEPTQVRRSRARVQKFRETLSRRGRARR